MTRILTLTFPLVFLSAAAFAGAPKGAGSIKEGKDEDTLLETMRGFTKALGVKCTYCHVKTEGKFLYPKWTKKKKRIALWMYLNFNMKLKQADGSAVTCDTCHHGRRTFIKKRALR